MCTTFHRQLLQVRVMFAVRCNWLPSSLDSSSFLFIQRAQVQKKISINETILKRMASGCDIYSSKLTSNTWGEDKPWKIEENWKLSHFHQTEKLLSVDYIHLEGQRYPCGNRLQSMPKLDLMFIVEMVHFLPLSTWSVLFDSRSKSTGLRPIGIHGDEDAWW